MSALMVCKTKMKDSSTVIEALTLLGIPSERVVMVDPNNTRIYWVAGKETIPEFAITRDSQMNRFGEVAFARDEEGLLVVLMDDMDELAMEKLTAPLAFTEGLGQWYAAAATTKALRDQGLFPEITRDGTRLRVTAQAF